MTMLFAMKCILMSSRRLASLGTLLRAPRVVGPACQVCIPVPERASAIAWPWRARSFASAIWWGAAPQGRCQSRLRTHQRCARIRDRPADCQALPDV